MIESSRVFNDFELLSVLLSVFKPCEERISALADLVEIFVQVYDTNSGTIGSSWSISLNVFSEEKHVFLFFVIPYN